MWKITATKVNLFSKWKTRQVKVSYFSSKEEQKYSDNLHKLNNVDFNWDDFYSKYM